MASQASLRILSNIQSNNGSQESLEEVVIPTLEFDSTPFGVAFHPSLDLVAAGFITGHVRCYKYEQNGHEGVFDEQVHKKSCRGVAFSIDGARLFSISRDKSLVSMDTMTGEVLETRKGHHEDAINAVNVLDGNIIATGDDSGVIKIWDVRKSDPVQSYDYHDDFVSAFEYMEAKRCLLTTSGDGRLGVIDIRKTKPLAVSEDQEDELLSVCTVRGGSKTLCGTQSGVVHIFSSGDWGDCTDRFTGHPSSVDCLLPMIHNGDDKFMITGSSDGLLRLCSTLPNELVGLVGAHDDSFTVEDLALSWDSKWLASSGGDDTVRFWNIEAAFQQEEAVAEAENEAIESNKRDIDSDGDSDDDPEPEPTPKKKKTGKSKKVKKSHASDAGDFFKDL